MTRRIADKICSADEAVSLIEDGMTIVSGGFVGAGHAESLTAALEKRFLKDAKPNGLTLVYAAGQGDGKTRGLNHLAHEGLLRRVIGGHWGLAPRLGKLAVENKIEGHNFPQGVICQLLRDIAAGRPGTITHVGLGTFIDPVNDAGRLGDRCGNPLVERIELGGRTWLWYTAFPIHVAFIRATAADSNGGLVMDDEAIIGEVLPIAQAVRNSGGIVIAQVSRLLDSPADPKAVRVPGILVDRIVVASSADHQQTFAEKFNPRYCRAALAVPGEQSSTPDPLPLDERRIIASRACDELRSGMLANLGIGMPEGIARIAAERNLLKQLTLTVESGPIGGMPAGGLSFGASVDPEAIVDQPAQFDFYDGGGLDFAALGAAEIDQFGNVNVSQFAGRFVGVGGFVNIAQNARRLVFCGTFTTGGLKVRVESGQLNILTEGKQRKFVSHVGQICFSSQREHYKATEVLYVTERAVFRLSTTGVELIEIAPGIDLRSQVIDQMGFVPMIREVKLMPSHCFRTFSNTGTQ